MVDEIIKLLEGSKTREALAEWWEDIVCCAHAVLNDEDREYGDKTGAEAIDLAFNQNRSPLWEFHLPVLQESGLPHIITAEELADAFFSLLPRNESDWMDEDAIENVYPPFLNRVRSLLTHRISRPFAIAQLPVLPTSDSEDNYFEIWSGNGISVGTCGTGRPDIDPEFAPKNVSGYPNLLYAIVKGRISPSAMEVLAQELTGAIRSLVRSSFGAAEADPDEGWSPVAPTGLPIAGVELVKREASVVRMCLQSYFAKPKSKKDSLGRRIRNAVTLLAEADGQQNDAVGIALAVTAIEALLGQRSEGISAALCDRVPALLEPDLKQRSQANDFMKRVYDDRSRVLHGENLDAAEERRREIRLLAGGVLYAVVNYVVFLRRGGFDPRTPDEFLNELREGKYSPGQPPGVPELPRVWNLWRKADRKVL